jgi:RNA-directed DNA polymerase
LRLKVNRDKTKISRPEKSVLPGFSFYQSQGDWLVRIATKFIRTIKVKCKHITQRSNGQLTKAKIIQLQLMVTGWVNDFLIAKAKTVMQ